MIESTEWITINVEPAGSPRPRVTKRGFAFMPEWYRRYMEIIKEELEKHNLKKEDYFKIQIVAKFKYPKSTAKKNLIEDALMRKKPDYDNTAKTITDVMEKMGLIENDSQICDANIQKRYTINNGKIEIKLFYFKNDNI